MPYTMQTAPPKNVLPEAALKLWVATFNAVAAEQTEDMARQAAWAQVKHKYEKGEDGKWVPKVQNA